MLKDVTIVREHPDDLYARIEPRGTRDSAVRLSRFHIPQIPMKAYQAAKRAAFGIFIGQSNSCLPK